MVPGDISPHLFNLYHSKLAVPVTHIFNSIILKGAWPNQWKVKYVTIIPKTNSASSPSECRNISCMNFLSKTFESFVFGWARKEVVPKNNQYGGEPGCGAEHFAVGVIDYVTTALEDNRAAVVHHQSTSAKPLTGLSTKSVSRHFNEREHQLKLYECWLVF